MEKGEVLLVSMLEKMKIKSIYNYIRNFLKKFNCEPQITLEQWEQIERTYSPHSSHHAQIYYRDKF